MESMNLAKEIIEVLYPRAVSYEDYIVSLRVSDTEDDIDLDSISGLIWLTEKLDKLKEADSK